MSRTYSISDYPKPLHKKYTLLKRFIGYIDQLSLQSGDTADIPSYLSMQPFPSLGTFYLSSFTYGPLERFVHFNFSDCTESFHFTDSSIIVIQRTASLLTYLSPTKPRYTISLTDSVDIETRLQIENTSCLKRYQLIKDSLGPKKEGNVVV